MADAGYKAWGLPPYREAQDPSPVTTRRTHEARHPVHPISPTPNRFILNNGMNWVPMTIEHEGRHIPAKYVRVRMLDDPKNLVSIRSLFSKTDSPIQAPLREALLGVLIQVTPVRVDPSLLSHITFVIAYQPKSGSASSGITLKLLQWLRVILVQDCALLYAKYPDSPIFHFAPFKLSSFTAFSANATAIVTAAQEEARLAFHTLPDHMARSMHGYATDLQIRQELNHSKLWDELQELQKQNEHLKMLVSSSKGLKHKTPVMPPSPTVPSPAALPPPGVGVKPPAPVATDLHTPILPSSSLPAITINFSGLPTNPSVSATSPSASTVFPSPVSQPDTPARVPHPWDIESQVLPVSSQCTSGSAATVQPLTESVVMSAGPSTSDTAVAIVTELSPWPLSTDLKLIKTAKGTTQMMLTMQPPIIRSVIANSFEALRASLLFEHTFPDSVLSVTFIHEALITSASIYGPSASDMQT
ncbi:hypothetical protein EI94DRAFT_1811631 [Lactarius quietus]|nr:hypothetical protein EI94DRAFT_1811631 [Lactarius quietus]